MPASTQAAEGVTHASPTRLTRCAASALRVVCGTVAGVPSHDMCPRPDLSRGLNAAESAHNASPRSHGPMDFLKPRYTPMNRRRRIYEGKAKVLYEGPEPGTLIQHFKDDATAFNAKKHEVIEGKGVLNNRISEYLFQRLNDIGVPPLSARRINPREQLIREVEIIPLEICVRNVA